MSTCAIHCIKSFLYQFKDHLHVQLKQSDFAARCNFNREFWRETTLGEYLSICSWKHMFYAILGWRQALWLLRLLFPSNIFIWNCSRMRNLTALLLC